jgi:hypothetical protein
VCRCCVFDPLKKVGGAEGIASSPCPSTHVQIKAGVRGDWVCKIRVGGLRAAEASELVRPRGRGSVAFDSLFQGDTSQPYRLLIGWTLHFHAEICAFQSRVVIVCHTFPANSNPPWQRPPPYSLPLNLQDSAQDFRRYRTLVADFEVSVW